MKLKNINFNGNFISFYFVPLLSSWAILILISGRTFGGPYNILLKGIQARIIGLFLLFITFIELYDFYNDFLKKKIKGNFAKNILKLLLMSQFFYSWLIVVFILIYVNYFNIKYGIYYYLIGLLICFFCQIKFLKKLKSLKK